MSGLHYIAEDDSYLSPDWVVRAVLDIEARLYDLLWAERLFSDNPDSQLEPEQ